MTYKFGMTNAMGKWTSHKSVKKVNMFIGDTIDIDDGRRGTDGKTDRLVEDSLQLRTACTVRVK